MSGGPSAVSNKAVVAGTLAGCIAIAAAVILPWEGNEPTGYVDIVGVATACVGHTGRDVVVGKTYSPEQCEAWFKSDVGEAARAVDRCVTVPMPDKVWSAWTSLAFNIGTRAFCGSTLVRKANAGDLPGACAQISRWDHAGGKRVRGLTRRRAAERQLCEEGL
ncbi:lysozyme [Luteimonas cucumeris]|uniref:lysozyme n=1 Tax=Luteimonas cucumeris TaxID=985012 RepID=UPI003CCC9CCB